MKTVKLLDVGQTHVIVSVDTDGERIAVGTSLGAVLLRSDTSAWVVLRQRSDEAATAVAVHKDKLFAFIGDLFVCVWDLRGDGQQGSYPMKQIELQPNHGLDICSRSHIVSKGRSAYLITKGSSTVYSYNYDVERIVRTDLSEAIPRSCIPATFDGKYVVLYEDVMQKRLTRMPHARSHENVSIVRLDHEEPKICLSVPPSACHKLNMEDRQLAYTSRDGRTIYCDDIMSKKHIFQITVAEPVLSLTTCGNMLVALLRDLQLVLIGDGKIISSKRISEEVGRLCELSLTRIEWFHGLSNECMLLCNGHELYEVRNWKS